LPEGEGGGRGREIPSIVAEPEKKKKKRGGREKGMTADGDLILEGRGPDRSPYLQLYFQFLKSIKEGGRRKVQILLRQGHVNDRGPLALDPRGKKKKKGSTRRGRLP